MTSNTAAAPLGGPIIIPRDSVFLLADAGAYLKLPPTCLPREVRLGRLRVSKRAGRYWVTGEALLAWLEGGVVSRRRTPAGAEHGEAR
jgi:hypothetical protein